MIAPTRALTVGPLTLGGDAPLVLIAGPCVIESEALVLHTAEYLKELTARLGVPFIFKASYDKANRSDLEAFRGPGLEEGLRILAKVRHDLELPVTSDIHSVEQARAAGPILDLIQVPAFLCRQTDILIAAGQTGKPVNVKKGQFMAPEDMVMAAKKIESTGNRAVSITERGAFFGYHNLVVDFRSLAIIRGHGYPLVFDATHSVQLPAAAGSSSGGDRAFIPLLARAAAAAGIDALFMETHPDPDQALCDGPNSWPLDEMEELLKVLIQLDHVAKGK
jgi:2-dehydro-3-deoxyphosphooctonate aldolase (KDO 8-P synthase)